VLAWLPRGVGGLAILIWFKLIYVILVYFHNTHQVLVVLPQGVGGLAILFYFILFLFLFIVITRTRSSYGCPKGLIVLLFYVYNTHQVLVGLPQGDGGLVLLFYLFCFHSTLVYFYNTHQVLVGLPQGVGGLAILFYFILFLFIVIPRTRYS
jgi:hypothetical protein